MTAIQQHHITLTELIKKIKEDPILNALVENDLMTEFLEEAECLVSDCLDEYNYINSRNIKLQQERDDLEDEVENLKYENDRLNEAMSGY